jgi:hypothetical protein
MPFGVEVERGQPIGVDRGIERERHEDLLLAPGNDVEHHLHHLARGEMLEHASSQTPVEPGRIGDERVRELERCPLAVVEPRPLVPCEIGDRRLVETGVPGTCQAKGQSGLAVVIAGAVQPNELGGDRVERM